MKYVEKSIIEILKDTRFSQFTGFCLNDVAVCSIPIIRMALTARRARK